MVAPHRDGQHRADLAEGLSGAPHDINGSSEDFCWCAVHMLRRASLCLCPWADAINVSEVRAYREDDAVGPPVSGDEPNHQLNAPPEPMTRCVNAVLVVACFQER